MGHAHCDTTSGGRRPHQGGVQLLVQDGLVADEGHTLGEAAGGDGLLHRQTARQAQVSARQTTAGLMGALILTSRLLRSAASVAIMVVVQFPPRLSRSTEVNMEFL